MTIETVYVVIVNGGHGAVLVFDTVSEANKTAADMRRDHGFASVLVRQSVMYRE